MNQVTNIIEGIQENYNALVRAMAEYGVDPPFDPRRVLSPNPLFYISDGVGPLIGSTVQFFGGTVTTLVGVELQANPVVGTVTAHSNNRVAIYIPGMDLYLGWLEEDEFRVLDIAPITSIRLN